MSKKYDDEDIISLREKMYTYINDKVKVDNKIENNIENGYIVIDGYKILFSERIVDDKIKVNLPTEYKQMEDKYIELKYPAYKNKNKIIFTNDNTSINFMFDFNNRYINQDNLEKARDQMYEILKKLHPTLVLLEKSIIKSPHLNVAYFEIVTPAMDKEIYNFMYFFILENNLVLGTFNCCDDDKKEWQPVIRQVIESLQVVLEGEA